ncbi:TRAP transporter small permease [uncultured Brevibacillus sp.]|uniref:TRAP transporter small permease n=1 Tax=uncultured Brevibacillus sp. TaxID=169970 RepID=UPI0025975FF3|nr:TRAP transporter small permease [uncultured Brevibacillus sp.]
MASQSEMEVKELAMVPLPKKSNFMNALDRLNQQVNHFLAFLAVISMVSMMLLIVANVLMRVMFTPIVGITELVGWSAAVTAALSLGYTQIYRGHVDIDVFVQRLPRRVRTWIQGLVILASLIFFIFLSYHFVKFSYSTMESGILSQTLGIVYYPVILVVSVGFFALFLSLLVDFLKICTGGDQN